MAFHGNAPFLPEELMINILKRLPVKSLIQFQCVSKRWKNLFTTPSFIADHLRHSSAQNPSLLYMTKSYCQPLHLCLINCEKNVLEVPIPPLIDSWPDVMIVGSSNGLLCVAIDMSRDSLFLWNPAIREVRQIPATGNSKFPLYDYDCTVGFGFSETVNDYKIVKAYAKRGDVISGVEMYSLSTDSWKNIEFRSLEGIKLFDYGVTVNGVISWYAVRPGDGDFYGVSNLVSFDIATEVFTLMPMLCEPDGLPFITVYEDKFAILSLSTINENPNYLYFSIDLWVLEEDIRSSTKRWSWTEKYVRTWTEKYSLSSSMLYFPHTIWRDEVVCGCDSLAKSIGVQGIEKYEEKVGLYFFNIITNECKMLAIPEYSLSRCVLNYVESLVPVGNIHPQEP